MAFLETSLAKAAFKKSFGRAHTSNEKDLGNESIPSSLPINLQDVFGELISSSASSAVTAGVALNCTGANKLSLTLDNTSNNKAYFVTVPSSPSHPLKSIRNPITDAYYATGDRVTRIIPSSFGLDYRAIMRKGDGTEIPPFASEDWFLDSFAGIITSEDPLDLNTTGTLECFVYIGKMLSDIVVQIGDNINAVSLQDAFTNGQGVNLDGYNSFTVSGTNEAYGVNFDVGGNIDFQTLSTIDLQALKNLLMTVGENFQVAVDGNTSVNTGGNTSLISEGYTSLSAGTEISFTDGYVSDLLLTDPNEQFGTALLTTRKSIIGAINEAFLASSGALGTERATYLVGSTITPATGLLVSSYTSGMIELTAPEGYMFNFTRDVYVYLNGQLLANDLTTFESNGNSVTNEVALNDAGTRLHFVYDLVEGDIVQVVNMNNQV